MDGVVALLGVSHHTAALRLLERAALSERAARRLLDELAVAARVGEAVPLSTCNRTELYAVAATAADADAALREALQRHSDVGAAGLACSAYSLADGAAVEHLFRVAAGLDSAVLGECEIVGQLRAAAALAREAGTLDRLLGGAVDHALAAGRHARRRTAIARGSTSLATVVAKTALAYQGERGILLI